MKKIIFSFLVLSLCMTANAQVDGFFPMFGQDAQWSVNDQFELVFTGDIAPAPVAGIATTFEGLVSDGIGGNDFTGMNIKFDATILDLATNTTIILAYDGTWGSKGINLEFNQWLCQATTDFSYGAGKDKWMITTPATYQTAVIKNGYNAFEINVDVAGLISCKVNGYVCDVPYQAPLASLKPTATSEFFVVFVNNVPGMKIKNMVVTKGAVTNRYFYNPEAAIDETKQASLSVYPNPGKGVFTINNESIGQKYQVTNILGQKIKTGYITSNKQQLDLTAQQAGSYMVVIEGENGKAVKQIVKN